MSISAREIRSLSDPRQLAQMWGLFDHLLAAGVDPSTIAIFAGEDGSIELTRRLGRRRIIVEVRAGEKTCVVRSVDADKQEFGERVADDWRSGMKALASLG